MSNRKYMTFTASLCILFGLFAITGSNWLAPAPGSNSEAGAGLSYHWSSIDMTYNLGTCEEQMDKNHDNEGDVPWASYCEGEILFTSTYYSSMCDSDQETETEAGASQNEDNQIACKLETAGNVGLIGLLTSVIISTVFVFLQVFTIVSKNSSDSNFKLESAIVYLIGISSCLGLGYWVYVNFSYSLYLNEMGDTFNLAVLNCFSGLILIYLQKKKKPSTTGEIDLSD